MSLHAVFVDLFFVLLAVGQAARAAYAAAGARHALYEVCVEHTLALSEQSRAARLDSVAGAGLEVEVLYAVERMMYNLKLGGVLEKLSGLIIGQFTEYEENMSLGKELYGALADLVKEYDYPICFGFPVGHVTMNVPMINGAQVMLEVGKKEVKLTFNTHKE